MAKKAYKVRRVNSLPSTGVSGDQYLLSKPNGRFELYTVKPDGSLSFLKGVSDEEQERLTRLDIEQLGKLEGLNTQQELDEKIQNAVVNSSANLIKISGTVLPRGANIPSYITNKGKAELYGGNNTAGTTYTNTGQPAPNNEFHIPQGSIGYAFYDKSTDTWDLEDVMELPQGIVPIKDILTSQSTVEALSANQGRVLNGNVQTIANVKNDVTLVARSMNLEDSSILYQGSTFSAWSSITVPASNFDSIKFLLRSWDINNPITVIRVQVRENNFDGAILGDVTFDYDFDGDTVNEHEIIATFSSQIANIANSPLCVLYLTNGNASLRGANLPGGDLRYVTGKQIDPVPAAFTPVVPNGARKIYVEFGNLTKSLEFTPASVASIKEKLPAEIRGGSMANEALDNSMSQTENRFSTSSGQDTWANESSTFTGWGQLLPAVLNFNGVKFKIRNWDVNNMITSVRILVRVGDRDGTIITDQTLDFNGEVGEDKDVIVTFPLFANENNERIWVEYNTNGRVGRYRTGASGGVVGETVRYRTTISVGSTFADSSGDDTSNNTIYTEVGIFEQKVKATDDFLETLKQQLDLEVDTSTVPDVIIPSEIYTVQGLEQNIYFDNVVVPLFGDKVNNYTIDITGSKGRHFEKMWRLSASAGDVGSNTMSLQLYKGTSQVKNTSFNVKVAAANAGNGITRKVLYIGDSTVDPDDMTRPLTEYFDQDVMSIECIGTRGPVGMKNEGYSGWRINDIATVGRTLYRFNVIGLDDLPGVNSVYSNNGSQFTVVEINITEGDGYFSCERTSGSTVPITGASTLTKISGVGPATINYDSSSVESRNPFWDGTKFSLEYYLTENGFTMSSGDWIVFQFGINDVFGLTDPYTAEQKCIEMWNQLSAIMDDIQTVVPGIRICINMTIPPSCSQDAFGYSYSSNQSRERYMKTGWIAWHRKLLLELNNATSRSSLRILNPIHVNLDTVNNFPKALYDANSRNSVDKITMWNNGVHPSVAGYAQMADGVIGLIKNYA